MTKTYLNSAGSFECVVDAPEAGWFGESPEKQTPYIRIPLSVSEDGPQRGQIAIWKGWLTDGAISNTITRLKEVFNFDGDLDALYAGRTTLTGKPCNITTEIETFEGKPKCKVAWLNPPGGGGAKPMEEGKIKSILGKLGPKAKAIAKSVAGPGAPNPTKAAGAPPKAEEGEEPMPF